MDFINPYTGRVNCPRDPQNEYAQRPGPKTNPGEPDLPPKSTGVTGVTNATGDSPIDPGFVQANNNLAFELMARAHGEGKDTTFSSLSVMAALAMIKDGAPDDVVQQMLMKMGMGGKSSADLDNAIRALTAKLQGANDVQTNMTNVMWTRVETPGCMKSSLQRLDAEVIAGNTDKAADIINEAVSKATDGKITDLVSPEDFTSNSILAVVNAILFRGTWTKSFDPDDTVPHGFRRADRSVCEVDMMEQKGWFETGHHGAAQVVKLPYGQGSTSMVLAKPQEGTALEELLQKLQDKDGRAQLLEKLTPREGLVRVPRFKVKAQHDLQDTLSSMGFPVGREVTYAKIDPMACVDFIKQRTVVEVNEEGTEAAAATAVGMTLRSCGPIDPPEILFEGNATFTWAIRCEKTGAILFSGIHDGE